eukprot:1160317-Pelagomonas_calceolata.AAC.18
MPSAFFVSFITLQTILHIRTFRNWKPEEKAWLDNPSPELAKLIDRCAHTADSHTVAVVRKIEDPKTSYTQSMVRLWHRLAAVCMHALESGRRPASMCFQCLNACPTHAQDNAYQEQSAVLTQRRLFVSAYASKPHPPVCFPSIECLLAAYVVLPQVFRSRQAPASSHYEKRKKHSLALRLACITPLLASRLACITPLLASRLACIIFLYVGQR